MELKPELFSPTPPSSKITLALSPNNYIYIKLLKQKSAIYFLCGKTETKLVKNEIHK